MGPSVPPLPAGARGVADARRPFVRIPRPAVPFREPAHTSRQTRSGVRGDCLARRARARPFVRIPRPAVPLREPARGIEREESAPSHRDASGDAGVMAAAMMLMRCRRASNVRCGSILLQKSEVAGRPIFRKNRTREATADSVNRSRLTEIACEFDIRR